MKVLFLYTYNQDFGGFNDLINKFGKNIMDKGHTVDILSDNIDYKSIKRTNERSFDVFYYNAKNVLKIFFRGGIDSFVFFEPFRRYMVFAYLYKAFHPKTKLSIYCCGSRTEKHSIIEEILIRMGRRFFINNFISCTYYSNKKVLSEHDDIGSIVYCPVDVGAYKQNTGINDKKVLSIDRLRERKNQLQLIEAFNLAYQKDSELTLDLVGDYLKKGDKTTPKNYAQKVIKKIKEYGLEDVVTLHGEVTDEEKVEWLKNATVFIKTSLNEMQGIIATEAVASGTPVIAFDNSGTHEVVRDGRGILVQDGDVEALADAIVDTVNNKELLRYISEKSRESAVKYSFEENLDKFYDIITR